MYLMHKKKLSFNSIKNSLHHPKVLRIIKISSVLKDTAELEVLNLSNLSNLFLYNM